MPTKRLLLSKSSGQFPHNLNDPHPAWDLLLFLKVSKTYQQWVNNRPVLLLFQARKPAQFQVLTELSHFFQKKHFQTLQLLFLKTTQMSQTKRSVTKSKGSKTKSETLKSHLNKLLVDSRKTLKQCLVSLLKLSQVWICQK